MKAYCKPKKIFVAIKIMDLEKITTSFEDIRVGMITWKRFMRWDETTYFFNFITRLKFKL